MSLERLINLAQRTGDRLIVHDKYGTDIVVMDVDGYEALLDRVEACELLHGEHSDSRDDVSAMQPTMQSEWDSVGQLLDHKFEAPVEEVNESVMGKSTHVDADYFSYGDDGLTDLEEQDVSLPPEEDYIEEVGDAHAQYDSLPQDHVEPPPFALREESEQEEEPKVEDVRESIPLAENSGMQWEEEPLEDSDEPMFYEEPV